MAVPGLRTVCYVEREAYAAAVLVARMEEKALDPAPVWDDVSTFDGRPWRGVVDLIAGGFPCQDVSNAGKRAGLDGARSGLWKEFARIIGEVHPRFVFIENVSALRSRGLDRVLADLAALGFDAEWDCFRASDVGAPHRRERIFILARAVADDDGAELRDQPRRSGGTGGPGAAESRHAGADVVDAESERQRKQDDEARTLARPDARSDAGGRCSQLGDADITGLEGRGLCLGERADERPSRSTGGPLADAESVGRAEGRAELEGWERLASPVVVGRPDCVAALAHHHHHYGREGERRGWLLDRERSACRGDADGCRGEGSEVGRLRAPWPPGPEDAEGWAAYLERWPGFEPAVYRGVDGLAYRMERLRLCGNGVVPDQAALAFVVLFHRLTGDRC